MNQNEGQAIGGFIPPMRIGVIVDQLVENGLGKEDAEKFLQTCADEGFQLVLATVEAALTKNLNGIVASEGVTAANMHLARYQFVAASSILTALTLHGKAYAKGEHPRFKRVQE